MYDNLCIFSFSYKNEACLNPRQAPCRVGASFQPRRPPPPSWWAGWPAPATSRHDGRTTPWTDGLASSNLPWDFFVGILHYEINGKCYLNMIFGYEMWVKPGKTIYITYRDIWIRYEGIVKRLHRGNLSWSKFSTPRFHHPLLPEPRLYHLKTPTNHNMSFRGVGFLFGNKYYFFMEMECLKSCAILPCCIAMQIRILSG